MSTCLTRVGRATTKRRRVFRLMGLASVVVIGGLIAAVLAGPRISFNHSSCPRCANNSLRGSLAGLRNAIDMYAAEHDGVFPAGADQAAIEAKLTKLTDANGVAGTTAGTHVYGPYLRSGFPPAPVGANKGKKTIKIVTGDPLATAATEGTGEGWIYSTDTGKIILNTVATDDYTIAYQTY